MQQIKTLLLYELEAFVTNEKEVARKESINENQPCDQQSRNNIIEPTVNSVAQYPKSTDHIPVFTKLPVTRSTEEPNRSFNVFEPHEVIRNHHEWYDALDNNYVQ
jgi:hypothetical protein